MPVVVGPAAVNQQAAPVDSAANPALADSESIGADQALTLLRALADPIRLQVVEALGQGERCVCELTSELALAQSKLSFHLKVLRQAGLIAGRQEGRRVYYRLEPAALGALRDWLAGRAAGCLVPAAPCC